MQMGVVSVRSSSSQLHTCMQTHAHTCSTHMHTRMQTYACAHTCTHMHARKCMHTHACTHMHAHMHANTCTHVHMHANTCMQTHAHTCMHTHACKHMHTHACTHMHTHACTHMHTHAYKHCTHMHAHTIYTVSSGHTPQSQHLFSPPESGGAYNTYVPIAEHDCGLSECASTSYLSYPMLQDTLMSCGQSPELTTFSPSSENILYVQVDGY